MSSLSEKVNHLVVEASTGCDSDFEIINHSDGEIENSGYQRLRAKSEPAAKLLMEIQKSTENEESQDLEVLLNNSKSEKIVLSLSQEQIYILRNQNNNNNQNEQTEVIKKPRSSSFAHSFNMVPIKIRDHHVPIPKPHLPEIVLTSFESNQSEKSNESSESSVKSVRSFSKDLTVINQPQRKASCESNHTFNSDVMGTERDLMNTMKPLNYNNKSLPYRLSLDINSHRPSDGGLNACHSDLNHIEHLDYHETIPSDLRCRICDNVFKDPRTLNCLHSFCLQCLINEIYGNDATIPFWSGPAEVQYD